MDEIDSRLRVRNPAAQVDGTVNPASLASLSLPGSDRDRSQALMNLSKRISSKSKIVLILCLCL